MSVAILIFLSPFKMLNPQGFAASCGIENDFISKSLIENLSFTSNVYPSITTSITVPVYVADVTSSNAAISLANSSPNSSFSPFGILLTF